MIAPGISCVILPGQARTDNTPSRCRLTRGHRADRTEASSFGCLDSKFNVCSTSDHKPGQFVDRRQSGTYQVDGGFGGNFDQSIGTLETRMSLCNLVVRGNGRRESPHAYLSLADAYDYLRLPVRVGCP